MSTAPPPGVHPAELISHEKGPHMSVFAPPSLPSPVSAQPAKPKRMWYLKKRWWALGVVVILLGAIAAFGGGTKSKTATSNTAAPITTATPAVSDATPHLSPLLFGTATPTFAAGEAGKLTIVQTDDVFNTETGTYFLVVRNNTDKTVSDIRVTGAARSGGKLVGSGIDLGFDPRVLNPGETAFGSVGFLNSESIPANTTVDFAVTADNTSHANSVDMQVTEANLVPANSSGNDIVVGSVTNNTDSNESMVIVTVLCFDGDRYQGSHISAISADLAPGATGTFSVSLDDNCPSFLVYAHPLFS